MKHRGRLHEVIRRAEKGPMIEEKDFEKNLITPTVKQLIKKYDIKFNKNTTVPDDDDLADRLYQAGLEFAVEVGLFCKDTSRRILWSQEEYQDALRYCPAEAVIGEDRDAVTIRARTPESPTRVVVSGGAVGVPVPEEMYIPLMLSYAKEPVIDLLEPASIESAYGMPMKAGSPLEIIAGWRDAEYRISDMADKIFGLPLMYSLSFAYNMHRRVSYNVDHDYISMYRETRWGGYLEAGGHALNWGLLKFTARWENHINNYPERKEEYYLSAIGVNLAVDTHDREPFPHRGVHLKSAYETASGFLGSEKLFNKFWGEADIYFTPIHRHTLCFRLSGATADRTTPFDERFRTGGMRNFPGLHLDEITGIIKINGRIEYRFDLLSRILADSYIGFRFDVAGSWDDPEAHISRQDWMHSGSIYLALDTIIGPLVLQWGHLLDIGPLPKQDILFLQIGNQF